MNDGRGDAPSRLLRRAVDVHGALTAAIVAFQLAMAAGAPWGRWAMAGAWPGAWPPALRLAALGQALLLLAFTLVLRARIGRSPRAWGRASRWLVWGVVAVNGVSAALNLATPSAAERMLWAPVAVGLLACSALVAWRAPAHPPGAAASPT